MDRTGTLWSVSDIVTALFDIFYHEHRRDGMNRALALKKAQVRLRFLSGDEFKLNYYQDLQKYFAEHLTSYLEQLELQIDTLNAQTDTVTEEEGTKILAEIAQLQASCDRASATTEMLDDYCEKSRPFGHPYYWAAFISQGMARSKSTRLNSSHVSQSRMPSSA